MVTVKAHKAKAIARRGMPLGVVPLLLVVAVIAPLFFVFQAAFTNGLPGSPTAYYTFSSIADAYTNSVLLTALRNTVVLGVAESVLSLAIAVPMAWVIVCTDTPLGRFFDQALTWTFYFSPLFLALAWIALADPKSGYLNLIFGTESIISLYSYAGIIFVSVLHFVPLSYFVVSNAMRSIPGSLTEASLMSGAGTWKSFRKVTIPMMAPALMVALLQVGIFGAEEFVIPWLYGSRFGINTLPTEIYSLLTTAPLNYNTAAAAGTMLLWFTVGGLFLYRRYAGKAKNKYATMTGKPTPPRIVKLGHWRWLTVGLVSIYLLLAVILPLLALLWGSLNKFDAPELTLKNLSVTNWTNLFQDPTISTAATNTLVLSIAGATATVLLAVLAAFAINRSRSSYRAPADYIISLPVAVPGLVLGLGFLWLYIKLPVSIPLYGTLLGLAVAYCVRYVGHALRTVSAGLTQIHSDLTDAASMSRASDSQIIRTVVVPLLGPTVIAAWVMIFVFFSRELNITILLYNQSTITVSVVIFNQLETSILNSIYPLALLQSLITFACVYMVRRRSSLGNPSDT